MGSWAGDGKPEVINLFFELLPTKVIEGRGVDVDTRKHE
jgi:hypothetical protein